MARSLGVYLTYVLRHSPDAISINMDVEGWVNVEELIRNSVMVDRIFTLDQLYREVAADEKSRFQLSDDKSLIRAVQGHSTPVVNLTFDRLEPPSHLFHGTSFRTVHAILSEGLNSGQRQYVHLSIDQDTAISVGMRKSNTVGVLTIQAKLMHDAGHEFFRSANGVWLTKFVPPEFMMER